MSCQNNEFYTGLHVALLLSIDIALFHFDTGDNVGHVLEVQLKNHQEQIFVSPP